MFICVASGPSLTDQQCALAAAARRDGRAKIIVVNDNWRKIPDADVLYACDGAWWKLYADEVRKSFRGACWTHEPLDESMPEREHAHVCRRYPWLNRVPVSRDEGMPVDGVVRMGGNSGYQAIGLAYLMGATRILLIGYDLQRGDGANKGRPHWFGDHPKPLTQGTPTSWLRRFDRLAEEASARGVHIINCTISTALTCFPRASLADVLCKEAA